MGEDVKRRPYDRTRRQAQAEETRRQILTAAQQLFGQQGYAGTTVEQIAAAAGVAVPTIYAIFGNKQRLLAALVRMLVSGSADGRVMSQTPEAEAVLAEPDQRQQLRLFARSMCEVLARLSPILAVVRDAARTDPALAELPRRMGEQRLVMMRGVAQSLAAHGPLRPGVDIEGAAETIWALTNGELYRVLTSEQRWSTARYEQWVADTLIAALLP